MASIKLIFSLILLLFVSSVLSQSLVEIQCQCKDGKLINCEGETGVRLTPGGGIAPAPKGPGGNDCPGSKDSPPGGKDLSPPPAPAPKGPGGKDCPGGKDAPPAPAPPGGKDCPGGKDSPPGGKDAPPPPAPSAPGGKDCPGGKDAPSPPAPCAPGGKDCPGGKDSPPGSKDAPPPPAPNAPGGKDCPGGKDAPPPPTPSAPGGKDCPGGRDSPPGSKDAPPPPAPSAPGGKDCPGGKDSPPGGKDAPPPPAPSAPGGKDCPGGKDSPPGGKDAPPPPAPSAPGGKICPGGKDSPPPPAPSAPGGKDCPGGKDAPPPPAPSAPGGKDCPGGKDSPPGAKDAPPPPAPSAPGGKDCPGGKDSPPGGKDAPPPPAPSAPGGKDCPGGKDSPPGGKDAPPPPAPSAPGGKDCPGGKNAPPGGKDAPPPPAPNAPGGKNCPGGKDTPGSKDGGVKAGFYNPPLYGQKTLDTDYKGEWVIHNPNVGVNAMQYQLMSNNKAVWFDTTNLGPSSRELGPKGNCPVNPDNNNEPDCFAHGVQYDIESGEVKSVYVKTDPWCSSGHVLPNGDLISTGGNRLGGRSVRLFSLTDPEPKFIEKEGALAAPRWYSSNCVLEDGSAVVVGGRDSYSYDLVPPKFDFKPTLINLPFLQQTTEPAAGQGLHVENNLYPFVYLVPDGNVFIFANNRAIRFNPKTGETVKEYPVLEGGSRNYPPSGQSALFPLRLSPDASQPIPTEVVVCGGNKKDAFANVDARYTQNRVFSPALADCNRIKVLADKPVWEKEQDMPSPRTMGDLLQLPNGQFLLINGAKKGTSGWEDGEDPNLTPTVYMPENEMGKRFKELNPTTIPRMYHSVSSVLPDGKILVAGSNAHQFYTFDGPYPTDLRVEKFSPHYLDPKLDNDRPVIKEDATDKVLKYGQKFKVTFTVKSNKNLGYGDVLLTLLYPPFTTHGFSQNQRLLITGVVNIEKNVITAVAPPSGKVAPPGYYLMFVNNLNVPSRGVWVHID